MDKAEYDRKKKAAHLFPLDYPQTDRYCFTVKETLTLPSELLLDQGRLGVWTRENVVFNDHRVRLGFHLFSPTHWQKDYTIPQQRAERTDTLFVCCDVGAGKHYDPPVTVALIVEIVGNYHCAPLLHRWDVTDTANTERTPFLPLGALEECYFGRKNMPNDPKNEVRLNVELAFYFERVHEDEHVDADIHKSMEFAGRRDRAEECHLFILSGFNIEVPNVFVEKGKLTPAASPTLANFFLTNNIYNVRWDGKASEWLAVMRYLAHGTVPRPIEITVDLIKLIVELQLRELQEIILQVIYPIRIRNIRQGFMCAFENMNTIPDVPQLLPQMFDFVPHEGSSLAPVSTAAMALGCLRKNRYNKPADTRYGRLYFPILLGAPLLRCILADTAEAARGTPAPKSPERTPDPRVCEELGRLHTTFNYQCASCDSDDQLALSTTKRRKEHSLQKQRELDLIKRESRRGTWEQTDSSE